MIYHKLSLSEISHCLIFPKYKAKLGNRGNHIAFKLKFLISSSVSLCLSQSKLGVLFVTSSLSVTKTQKSKVSSHLDSNAADSTGLITERVISRFGSIVVEFFWYYCCTVTEADAELKEEVKHLKSMLEQQAIQMAEQRRHFEEQQASQLAEQRAHYDNMMMQMLNYITSQSAQSSSDH